MRASVSSKILVVQSGIAHLCHQKHPLTAGNHNLAAILQSISNLLYQHKPMYFHNQISHLRPVQKFSLNSYFKSASVVRISQFRIFISSRAHQSEGRGHGHFISIYIYTEGTKVARAALCIRDFGQHLSYISRDTHRAAHTLTNPLLRFSLSYRFGLRVNLRTGS
jgi:hypothetical protein